jgi:hypothetical protein
MYAKSRDARGDHMKGESGKKTQPKTVASEVGRRDTSVARSLQYGTLFFFHTDVLCSTGSTHLRLFPATYGVKVPATRAVPRRPERLRVSRWQGTKKALKT